MVTLETALNYLIETAEHPYDVIQAAKQEGRGVVGCVPYFVPLELVHAAGMQPIELWGGGLVTGAASSYYPAFYCSLLFELMERALDGTYDVFDAVIVPTTCDGLRNLEENWKFAKPDTVVIDFVPPVVRYTNESHRYLVGQLRGIACKLEAVTGKSISERALRESIAVYNLQRQLMREFSVLAARHADVITPYKRWAVFASARTMAVEQHVSLMQCLNKQLRQRPEYVHEAARIILTGIYLDSAAVLDELEKNDVAVVGDWTVAESARYNKDLPVRINPFDSLAALWEEAEGISIALDPKKARGNILADMVHERGADGVIACVVKFCEEEEFDVPILKQQLDSQNIPLLVLEMESQTASVEQVATRIQAFIEMLELR